MPLFTRPKDEIAARGRGRGRRAASPRRRHRTPRGRASAASPPTARSCSTRCETLRPFGIGLLDAAGLTLCESIVSDIDLPTFTAATVAG